MKRIIAVMLVVGLVLVGAFMVVSPASHIVVTNAQATGIEGRPNMFMVTLTIDNDGDAVELTGVTAENAMSVSVMNPGYGDAALVIPANSQGLLAMDGAHLMLMTGGSGFEEGALMPLTLRFGDHGDVTTRVLNAGTGMGGMDHGASAGVQVTPAPTIALASDDLGAQGGAVSMAVGNFDLVVAETDAAHVAGQGHAHVYLNGLKLFRLYQPSFALGALRPGDYDLTVSLNTNDHRAYTVDGAIIQDTIRFNIPPE